MPDRPVERKLAAIFAADIAGYSRLMSRDETGTLARLKACRAIIDRLILEHRGRIFNTAGDSVVADFASAVDAVRCAVAVQTAIAAENASGDADEPMLFRIGVHVGDVMVDGTDLLGDEVNIAARLESLADPGAICVSGAARDYIGNKLPLAFVDLGEQPVKNMPPIRAYRVQTTLTHPVADAPGSPLSRNAGEGAERQRREAGEGSPPVLALLEKPSIAVLPFQNMSGDPEQEYFADGMVEEIITALSRIHWLFVIARNSTFTYKGKAVDVRQVGRELGVRYVLEGSVRKAADRVRITCQLIEAQTGTHLWADRFDGSLADVFDLQDQVAASVAGVIEPALQAAEVAHVRSKRPENLDAYDLYLRALPELRALTAEGSARALDFLRRAIEMEPAYASALAQAAFCYTWRRVNQWMADEDAEIADGVRLARAAMAADRDDAAVLAYAGYALWFFEGAEAAVPHLDRAVALNPNSAVACGIGGNVHAWAGNANTAIERCTRAMRLSPRDPWTFLFLAGIGIAHLTERRPDEALVWLRRAHDEHPSGPLILAALVSAYGHLGRLDEARVSLQRLVALGPRTVPAWRARLAFFKHQAHREFVCEGLRLAGMSEE